jgi:Arc/MetJ family transcription regulator
VVPYNLDLDDRLVEEAKRLGKHRTRKAAVNEALAEYVARHKRHRVLELFRTLEWDPKYHYKTERRRRR